MTKEEKAEFYSELWGYDEKSKAAIKRAYIDALKEGEKENEQLKEQNKTILEDNDTLNKWVDDLRKENENYKMAENESLEIIADLKAENEKLKTCRNCKKEFTEICETCRRGLYDGEFDNWELAE